LAQGFAEGGGQLFFGYLAFAELEAEVEGVVFGLVVEDEGLGAGRWLGFFLAGAAGFVAGEAAADDALDHFVHFLFGGLAGDLKEE
jgi:hypothetical protein